MFTEYWDLINKYPNRLQGGWIWEWMDHGILVHSSTGEPYYAYGGDFGEDVHDGNFVCDGLVFPDRKPSPGLLQAKVCHQPVLISLREGNGGVSEVELKNLFMFTELSGYLAMDWRLLCNGRVVKHGTSNIPTCLPGQTVVVQLPAYAKDSKLGEWAVGVSLKLKEARPWAEAGYELCIGDAVVVPRAAGTGWWESPSPPKPMLLAGAQLSSTIGRHVEVVAPNATLTFDRSLGVLTSWTVSRVPLMLSGPQLQLWRAPTDNDMYFKRKWRTDGLDKIRHRLDSFDTSGPDRQGVVKVTIGTRAGPPVWDWGIKCTYTYTIYPTGNFDLHIKTEPNGAPFPDTFTLPRLGVQLRIPTPSQVEWYGLGPGESYADTHEAARLGIWRANSVKELETDYVTPQENGNRFATRWVRFGMGATGAGFGVLGSPELNFGVKDYETSELDKAGHRHELGKVRKSNYAVVSLDYGLNGIGTNSCGPGPLEQYLLKPGEVREWSWRFERVDGDASTGSML